MKYKLYRAQYEMQFDENGEPLEWEDAFELVGVEYAQDVDRATPLLIKAIIHHCFGDESILVAQRLKESFFQTLFCSDAS